MDFLGSSTLSVEGENSVSASVQLQENSQLNVRVGEVNKNCAALTLDGSLNMSENAMFTLSYDEELSPGTYKLLTMASGNGASTGIDGNSLKLLNHSWETLDAYWLQNTFYVELGHREVGDILLNTASPTSIEDWGIEYVFDYAHLKLQGDWHPGAGTSGELLVLYRWEGSPGVMLELSGQGCIELDNGYLDCIGGEFTIGKDICLKNTSLDASEGSTEIFNGSVELSPSSWPVELSAWWNPARWRSAARATSPSSPIQM